jgi:hypothetical protein
MVDAAPGAQPRELGPERRVGEQRARGGIVVELGHRLDVEVEQVPVAPTDRAVRARLVARVRSACSGLSPTNAAPCAAARSASACRSVRSPIPQLRRLRTA